MDAKRGGGIYFLSIALHYSKISLLNIELNPELFNIPDWECPDTLKAPFYEGLERNEHSMSPILWLGVGFLGRKA